MLVFNPVASMCSCHSDWSYRNKPFIVSRFEAGNDDDDAHSENSSYVCERTQSCLAISHQGPTSNPEHPYHIWPRAKRFGLPSKMYTKERG